MKFKEWLDKSGFSYRAFGKLAGLPASTIFNLASGRPPIFKTVKKLVRITKNYENPITYDMFPFVYERGLNKFTSMKRIRLKQK